MRWVTAFSRSGSEIYNLSKILGREPDLILTNKKDFTNCYYKETECIYIDNSVNDWNKYLQEDDIITLHGYLRIVPPEICEKYNIINGHPAPVHLYPELKGKDKQEDLYNYKDKYRKIGCIIHKVTAGVDEGEILYSKDAPNNLVSVEDAYNTLQKLSLESWKDFFKNYYNIIIKKENI